MPAVDNPKEIRDRQRACEGVDLATAVAAGVHRADDRAHAAADYQVRAYAETVEDSKYTDMGQPFGATSRKDQSRPR